MCLLEVFWFEIRSQLSSQIEILICNRWPARGQGRELIGCRLDRGWMAGAGSRRQMERWVEKQTEITSVHSELLLCTPLQTACVDTVSVPVYPPPVTVLFIDQSFGLCRCECMLEHKCVCLCVCTGLEQQMDMCSSRIKVCNTSDHC